MQHNQQGILGKRAHANENGAEPATRLLLQPQGALHIILSDQPGPDQPFTQSHRHPSEYQRESPNPRDAHARNRTF
ncbi:hypothetical protein GCM10017624_46730 [Azotobacter vinelandii]|nr:hypothetical protein GCM10017624_46730 [Azotobacter vinelandii]